MFILFEVYVEISASASTTAMHVNVVMDRDWSQEDNIERGL